MTRWFDSCARIEWHDLCIVTLLIDHKHSPRLLPTLCLETLTTTTSFTQPLCHMINLTDLYTCSTIPQLVFLLLLKLNCKDFRMNMWLLQAVDLDMIWATQALSVSFWKNHHKHLNMSVQCVSSSWGTPIRSPAVATASVWRVFKESKMTRYRVHFANKKVSTTSQTKGSKELYISLKCIAATRILGVVGKVS